MEPVIAVLPAHVIDQIAAGEVIERPASVVKELVDNAIDAGARTITVETTAGGRALIRVCDDGCGMSAASAVLSLERHATSKIRAVDDLWGLASMGFRGEALPSIASVSRMTITTRRQGDLAATRIVIEASRLVSVSEVGAPVGTTVEVADLLHNLPARLKFLKGEATEASHITDFVAKIAIAHPALHLRLKHNGRTALDAPPDRDGFARVQAMLGSRIAARMVPIRGEEAGVRVEAYLAAPELAQATARGVQLFVGRRPIRDRGLLHAITMGYGELIPRGRYPNAVVLLDVPAGAVDINVHPQKQEVRFSEASEVCAAVRHVVQAGVASAPWRAELGGIGPIQMSAMTSVAPPRLPLDGQPATAMSARYAEQLRAAQGTLGFDRRDAADGPRAWASQVQHQVRMSRAAEAAEARAVDRATDASEARARAASIGTDLRAGGAGDRTTVTDAHGDASVIDARGDSFVTDARGDASVTDARGDGAFTDARGDASVIDARGDVWPGNPANDVDPALADGSGPVPSNGFFSGLRYLGQLDLTYLVCDGDGELVLVDQHSAHERVELERLRTHSSNRDVPIQKLLFPVTLEASPAEIDLVPRVSDLLARVGFEVDVFGKSTLAVKAVPAGIRHGDPTQLLRKLLTSWVDDGAPSEEERLERVLAEIACHSVVRAGDRLSPSEAEALLRGLDGCEQAAHGPHGRPILLRLPLAEIARRFGR